MMYNTFKLMVGGSRHKQKINEVRLIRTRSYMLYFHMVAIVHDKR